MGWIWWLCIVMCLMACAESEEKMGKKDSIWTRIRKWAPAVAAVAAVIVILCGAIWWIFRKAVDEATKDRYVTAQDFKSVPESLKEITNKLEGFSTRLATLEGRLLSSNKVKKAEAQITAKLPPNQKALPVVVDMVDVLAGRIHVWDAQGFPREFLFSADAKVYEKGEKTQLMQMFKNPFKGQTGILVYEAQASAREPAVAKSLTLIPTP